jgi:hypothetical protein
MDDAAIEAIEQCGRYEDEIRRLNGVCASLTALVRATQWAAGYDGCWCPWCSVEWRENAEHAKDCPALPYLSAK